MQGSSATMATPLSPHCAPSLCGYTALCTRNIVSHTIYRYVTWCLSGLAGVYWGSTSLCSFCHRCDRHAPSPGEQQACAWWAITTSWKFPHRCCTHWTWKFYKSQTCAETNPAGDQSATDAAELSSQLFWTQVAWGLVYLQGLFAKTFSTLVFTIWLVKVEHVANMFIVELFHSCGPCLWTMKKSAHWYHADTSYDDDDDGFPHFAHGCLHFACSWYWYHWLQKHMILRWGACHHDLQLCGLCCQNHSQACCKECHQQLKGA